MILDIFPTDDSDVYETLVRIDRLIKGEHFLKALSHTPPLLVEKSFHVVNDIELACKQMTSQEIWDLPEPWPFQYFPGVVSDEAARLEYETGLPSDIRVQISEQYQAGVDDFNYSMFNLINEKLSNNNFISYLCQTLDKDDAEYIVNDIFPNEIENYLQLMIMGAYFGRGFKNSSIFQRMYDAFLTGGIPCGWVGPLPEDGGRAKECLQLFYP